MWVLQCTAQDFFATCINNYWCRNDDCFKFCAVLAVLCTMAQPKICAVSKQTSFDFAGSGCWMNVMRCSTWALRKTWRPFSNQRRTVQMCRRCCSPPRCPPGSSRCAASSLDAQVALTIPSIFVLVPMCRCCSSQHKCLPWLSRCVACLIRLK